MEIIGDTDEEGNKNFFLEVFNPVGGSFVGNAVALVAMRTIIDDDGLYP